MNDFKELNVPGDVYASYISRHLGVESPPSVEEMHKVSHPSTLILTILSQSINESDMESVAYMIDMAKNVARVWGSVSDYNIVDVVYRHTLAEHLSREKDKLESK